MNHCGAHHQVPSGKLRVGVRFPPTSEEDAARCTFSTCARWLSTVPFRARRNRRRCASPMCPFRRRARVRCWCVSRCAVFAEPIWIWQRDGSFRPRIHEIPAELADATAAPLLCAGAIGWRALRLTRLLDGEPLELTGFGASAHLVLQVVRARFPGSRVYVFARNAVERDFARALGATWAGDTADTPPELLAAVIDTTRRHCYADGRSRDSVDCRDDGYSAHRGRGPTRAGERCARVARLGRSSTRRARASGGIFLKLFHSARVAATSTPVASASQAPRMNVSRTALVFHAAKNAMLAAMIGGRKTEPRPDARNALVHVQVSREKAAADQLAAMASTIAGPVKTSSSTTL